MRIGFIGTGEMGSAMIKHWREAGHDLQLYVRTPEKAKLWQENGFSVLDSPSECAQGVDVLALNVTATEDVDEVLFGEFGAESTLAPETTVLDFSTIDPLSARRFAQRLAAKGVEMLDCPVSGGVAGAKAGTLSVMVGGSPEALNRVRPLLNVFAKAVTYIGPAGSGQVAKACNQIAQVITIQGVAESMRFAHLMDVDPKIVLEAITKGFAGSRMLELMGPKMISRDFSAGIEARLHHKDLNTCLNAAQSRNALLPATALVAQQLGQLMAFGWGHDDTSSLLRVLEAKDSEKQSIVSTEGQKP